MYKHTPLPPGAPNVGSKSTSPEFHAHAFAERGIASAPIDADSNFLAPPTRNPAEISMVAKEYSGSNWAAPAGVAHGFVVMRVGPYQNPNPHEMGELPASWTLLHIKDRTIFGIYKWFRIDGVAADPEGEIEGVASIQSMGLLPGSRLEDGSSFVFADGFANGELALAKLPGDWLWAFKRAAISAAPRRRTVIKTTPLGGRDDKGGWML